MGQRFPAGYPVATVNEVIHDSGQPFAIVRAIPTASLNRSRYMLLVFSDRRTPEERATEAAIAQEEADRQGHGQAPANPATPPAANATQPAATPAPAAHGAAPATAPAPAAHGSTPASAPAQPAAAPAQPRRQ